MNDPDFSLAADLFDIGEGSTSRIPSNEGGLGNAEWNADNTIFVEAGSFNFPGIIDDPWVAVPGGRDQHESRAIAVRHRIGASKLERDYATVRGKLHRGGIE
nr:hypothetical protein BV87_04475 [Sphingobium yanoikuyae]